MDDKISEHIEKIKANHLKIIENLNLIKNNCKNNFDIEKFEKLYINSEDLLIDFQNFKCELIGNSVDKIDKQKRKEYINEYIDYAIQKKLKPIIVMLKLEMMQNNDLF